MVFFSSNPACSNSFNATETDCLLVPGSCRSRVLKRNGPSSARRKICGFHFPDINFSRLSAGQLSGELIGRVVMFF